MGTNYLRFAIPPTQIWTLGPCWNLAALKNATKHIWRKQKTSTKSSKMEPGWSQHAEKTRLENDRRRKNDNI